MQNTSKLNTILLIVAIVLLAAGIWAILSKKGNSESTTYNFPISEDITSEDSIPTPNKTEIPVLSTTITETWSTSPVFSLQYPKGVEVYETKNPYVEVRFTYEGAVISWGGGADTFCMPDGNEYGIFQPGVTTIACVRGQTARIGVENVRNTISQKALTMFGDFVLKNK